jgi:hypothetical protein
MQALALAKTQSGIVVSQEFEHEAIQCCSLFGDGRACGSGSRERSGYQTVYQNQHDVGSRLAEVYS